MGKSPLPRPSSFFLTLRTRSKTGVVFNVTPRGVGVIVRKVVGNRYLEKRVNVRIEHVRHSGCRKEFLQRVKTNAKILADAKEKGGSSRLL